LPNVVLEAMALEVPVLATRIAGLPTLVQDGVSGLLVEPEDSAALAAGLGQLLGDAALRGRFVEAARRTIETTFSFERRMRRVAGIYDALLARTPAAAPAVADHA
jgi:glycosyltransferase involved in cell wall biosynthesis